MPFYHSVIVKFCVSVFIVFILAVTRWQSGRYKETQLCCFCVALFIGEILAKTLAFLYICIIGNS